MKKTNRRRKPRDKYNKHGIIFLIPFFVVYIIFSLIPLFFTFWNSLFENYMSGLKQVGPTFIGIDNFKTILTMDLFKYTGNTVILWLLGFIPQIIISLLLAVWFSDMSLKIRGKGFFKVIMYMPNIIMASAFAMLFSTIFSTIGPINNVLISMEFIKEPIRFLNGVWTTRGLIATMGFLMWFGNTTILLMAAIMGVDVAMFESAKIDGASSFQIFRKITIPLIKPIMSFVIITSMIGGIQSFDVPEILTGGSGGVNRTSMTLIMYLNKLLFSKNYGLAGALSVVLFVVTATLSIFIFRRISNDIIKEEKAGGKNKNVI